MSGLAVDHAAIALAPGFQMLAQGEAGGFDILPLDGLIDAAVLHLDLFEVEPPLLRRLSPRADFANKRSVSVLGIE